MRVIHYAYITYMYLRTIFWDSRGRMLVGGGRFLSQGNISTHRCSLPWTLLPLIPFVQQHQRSGIKYFFDWIHSRNGWLIKYKDYDVYVQYIVWYMSIWFNIFKWSITCGMPGQSSLKRVLVSKCSGTTPSSWRT